MPMGQPDFLGLKVGDSQRTSTLCLVVIEQFNTLLGKALSQCSHPTSSSGRLFVLSDVTADLPFSPNTVGRSASTHHRHLLTLCPPISVLRL